ncbi:MAG: hypothetical protein AAGJ34_01360 [Pseudomonadota bacterium]
MKTLKLVLGLIGALFPNLAAADYEEELALFNGTWKTQHGSVITMIDGAYREVGSNWAGDYEVYGLSEVSSTCPYVDYEAPFLILLDDGKSLDEAVCHIIVSVTDEVAEFDYRPLEGVYTWTRLD